MIVFCYCLQRLNFEKTSVFYTTCTSNFKAFSVFLKCILPSKSKKLISRVISLKERMSGFSIWNVLHIFHLCFLTTFLNNFFFTCCTLSCSFSSVFTSFWILLFCAAEAFEAEAEAAASKGKEATKLRLVKCFMNSFLCLRFRSPNVGVLGFMGNSLTKLPIDEVSH